MNKDKVLAHFDVGMGGHCAEELFLGREQVTSGASGDLTSVTKMAYASIEKFGMFGEEVGYISTNEKISDDRKAMIDNKVKVLLK